MKAARVKKKDTSGTRTDHLKNIQSHNLYYLSEVVERHERELHTSHKPDINSLYISNMSSGCAYNDVEWDNLPEDVKKAAETLGYNQELWDEDDIPDSIEDCDWDDLTKDQQDAATVLGYDQESWDNED